MQFVEMDCNNQVRDPGYAPYLDYRPMTDEERALAESALKAGWLCGDPSAGSGQAIESRIVAYAAEQLVPQHLDEVRTRKEELVSKTKAAVQDRLTKEIIYWDHRANELQAQEAVGRPLAKMNSALARQRADDLEARLRQRMEELEQERHLSPLPPVIVGGALVVPQALLNRLKGETTITEVSQADRERIDAKAMDAVMEVERKLNRHPRRMPHENPGYDIESQDPANHRLLFIEVKGKAPDSTIVTVSKTQILTALNKQDDFILAIVEVEGDTAHEPCYIRRPFQREPDFGVTSVNYDLQELLSRSERPA
jgi:hypothetical protein